MKRFLTLVLLLAAASCSTTRSLSEGESRLVENKVVILNDKNYVASELTPYIKQKPNGYFIGHFNPFLCVYNWRNGKGKGWDKFCEKLGQAPVVFDSTLVGPSVKGIISHLEYMGYYDSEVDAHTTINDKKAFVQYDVKLGKQYPLDKILYAVEDSTLNAQMNADSASFTISRGDPLSENALEIESERLAQLFRDNGYWGFTKNYFFYYADTTKNRPFADLTVLIEDYTRNETPEAARPHIRYNIGKVRIVPQDGLKVRQKFLDNINRIKPGSPYSEKDITNTYERYSSVPLFSSVNMQLNESDSATVDCTIMLSPSKIQSVKFNLEGYFNSAGLIGVAPSLNYTHKNIFGGGEIWNLGLQGNFQFKLKEPVSSNEFTVNTSLSIPQFWLLPHRIFNTKIPRTEIKLAYNFNDRPEYLRHMSTAQYGYSWNTKENRLSFQLFPIWVNLVKAKIIDEEFYKKLDPFLLQSFISHIDLGAKFDVYYTTSNQINPDHTYFYLRGNVATSGNLVGALDAIGGYKSPAGQRCLFGIPYDQFVRAEVSAVQTWRFGRFDDFALAARIHMGAGVVYGNSFYLPEEQRFYVGGVNSMRGWSARILGPGMSEIDTSYTIRNQTGDMRLEANLEFRFPIFWKLKGALFVDAGNVWNLPSKHYINPMSEFNFRNFFRSSALDWGLGARLDFGLLLVRLDWGYKLYDPRAQVWYPPKHWFSKDGYALHFGIGYPF